MTLDNLYGYLKESFKYISVVKDSPCIIALGNTGCGKSTMFNSLIYGPECLKKKTEKVEIAVPEGDQIVMKKKNRVVIDMDP